MILNVSNVRFVAGIVGADYEHGWKVGNEYTYVVRSRTLTGLDKISNQYNGLLTKALLTVQAKDADTLGAKLSHGQYANIHTDLPNGWDSEVSDQNLDLRSVPCSGKPFEIKIKQGVIRDLIVDKSVPTWEVNLVKSVVSQLQLDTLGANAIKNRKITQVPKDDEPYGSYPVMEDSVSGKCEVRYDITPLSDFMIRLKPELVPLPKLKGDGHHIDIMKTKNFGRCEQRMGYHFGLSGMNKWEPGSNDNGQFLSRSSTSRVIISGSLKKFVIQSSVTTSKMLVSPRFYDEQIGLVVSKVNLTLAKVNMISQHLPSPADPESTGNLVYVYDNPFSDSAERRNSDPNRGNLLTSDSIASISSSEEALKDKPNIRGSSSSSSSSSSISSSEEHRFWQPKPTLEDAPQNPLLPNFIGVGGKYIGQTGNVDSAKAAKEILVQIAIELEDAGNIPTEETLEKFTMLTSLLRTMSRKKLAEIEPSFVNDIKTKEDTVKQNAWAVLRDAMAQAGTGPALLTIKDWIKSHALVETEAADVVTRLPKTARTPTAEYVRAFFELATCSEVLEDQILRVQSILSFAEMVRKSQVNKRTVHNRYPVHAFGRMISKHDRTVVNEYIPYLEKELRKAVKEDNTPLIQTYILALGTIAHPKILAVFEPFLEGREKMTPFQRTLIVASLDKLTMINPKLAQSVLYKIYLNTMEVHEVRCAAVYLLMKTNPPLSMLQRMAEFTNYDTNKHVNSAVKSSIQSLAQQTSWKELADKARAVVDLLNPEEYSYRYSHGFISERLKEGQNIINIEILNYIGSSDNYIPEYMHYASYNSYGDFKTPPTDAAVMLSNVKAIFKIIFGDEKKQQTDKMPTEKLAEELNIIPEEPIDVEGNLMWDDKFSSGFVPFDKRMLRSIPKMIAQGGLNMKNGKKLNLIKMSTYEVTLSFPMETGLPFLFTFKVPILKRLQGTAQLHMGSDKSISVKADLRPTYSKKIQGRVGFLAPFEHKHFIAGVDMNFQAYFPIRVCLDATTDMGLTKLQLWPLKGEHKARMIHYSVIPYTSQHDILSMQPVMTDKNTHQILLGKPRRQTKSLPLKDLELFELQMVADEENDEFWKPEDDFADRLIFTWTQKTDLYRKADLYMNIDPDLKDPLTITASIADLNVMPDVKTEKWSPLAKAVAPKDPSSNTTRISGLLAEVVEGIKAAQAIVFDLEFQIPGEFKSQHSMTFAYAESNMDNKRKSQMFFNTILPSSSSNYQVCIGANQVVPMNTMPSYEIARELTVKEKFDTDIRFGTTCEQGEQMNLKGEGVQSKQLREQLLKSPKVKNCLEQMNQGNKILKECQKAAASIKMLDEYKFSLSIESEVLRYFVNKVVDAIGNTEYLDTQVDTAHPVNAEKNAIDMKIKLSQDLDTADLTIHTSDSDIKVNKLGLSMLDLNPQDLMVEDSNVADVMDDNLENSCVVDKTRVETFDSNNYPVHLGNCWHAIMTTYRKQNPEKKDEKLRIPKDTSVSILARETEDGHKEVKIMLGERQLELKMKGSRPEAWLDSKLLEVTQDKGFQHQEDYDVMLEIVRLADDSIAVMGTEQEVTVIYDGQRILIKASDDYRYSVRGLCGNFDGEETNDFWAPKNCAIRKPDIFVASYALTKNECEGPSLENAKLVYDHCTPHSDSWQSNVISDIDVGRENTEKFGYQHSGEEPSGKQCIIHRTQVKEHEDKLCFTIRPVVTCAPGCSPAETKDKMYQYHCIERNEASLKLKKRIEKGANPDLSQKPISASWSINVPLSCKA
ncbi:vitellogenin isoform X1 [Megalopta genalis]|uniref:vitellogenin isoform X1 n=1 Tax=Megalopta genalis TaxID=115081 RepID=UPI003FD5FA3B